MYWSEDHVIKVYLFNFELKVWSSSFTLLQKIKQIFTYTLSTVAIIPEREKAIDIKKSECCSNKIRLNLAVHDQFHSKSSFGGQRLAAYIMIILLLLLLRALFYLTNRPTVRHTVFPHIVAGMAAESANPYWLHKIIIV
jgi:hypothetical protein